MLNEDIVIEGFCAPGFEEVRAEFSRNFADRREIGAAVAVFHRGKPVVDLWGGLADRDRGTPWREDSLAVIFSSTKGLAAMCMHILLDRGQIALDAPVATYWPEFGANGKEGVTVAMVLAHQAGVPAFRARVPENGFTDWDGITALLAAEAPVWEPGTQHGYHALTIGFIEGEIVRRVTGKTIGAFLRAEIAEPFGADVWIGLPDGEHGRAATSYLDAPNPASELFRLATEQPSSLAALIVTNTGNDVTPESINSAARRRAEIPAAGGMATARGLARAYRPLSLDGSVDGRRMVRETALPLMRTVRSASGKDHLLRIATTFTLGFSKSWGDRRHGPGEHAILGEQAFGTVGMGGSVGFADGEAELAFGYVMNLHGPGVGLNDRGQSLIDAAYRAVGYRSSAPGFWVR